MKRVLAPEITDSYEAARDYDDMEHGEVSREFVDDLLALGNFGNDILDVGTGTSWIAIEVCRRLEDCRIMAIDLSTYMLDLARLNIEIAGLIQRITLDHVDARQLPYPDQYFDLVMSNRVLHHFEDPSLFLRGAIRVVRPEGLLFVRDFVRPESEERVVACAQALAAGSHEAQQAMYAEWLRSSLELDEIRNIVQGLGYAAESVQPTGDYHWTWIARRNN
jgi:ubiquinone/menaquinone biosynthesis C-methylase UbiE